MLREHFMGWFNQLRVRWKISLPLILLLLLFITVSANSLIMMHSLADQAEILSDSYFQEITLLLDADRDLYQVLVAERGLVMLDDNNKHRDLLQQDWRDNLKQAHDRIQKAMGLSRSQHAADYASDLAELHDAWKEDSGAVLDLRKKAGVNDAAAIAMSFGKSAAGFDKVRGKLDNVVEERQQEAAAFVSAMQQQVETMTTTLVTIVVVGLIISVTAILWVPRAITGPLVAVSQRVSEIASGGGDLRHRLQADSADEIGDLGRYMNRFLDTLAGIVGNIKKTTIAVTDSSQAIARQSATDKLALDDQAQAIHAVVTAVEEMSAAIREVSTNTTATADQAAAANDISNQGLLVVERAMGSIDGLSRELGDASAVISDVESKATQVNSVIDVIRGIAEQTNLLALNAAIEAARAGEQGRGFAVVADEVRTLASRTQDSTRDIQTMLEGLQSGVMKAVTAIRTSVQTAEGAVKLSSEAGNSLNEINSALIEIKGKSIQIAAAVEEQSAVIEEINRNMVRIGDQSRSTSEGASQSAAQGRQLDGFARDLTSNVERFVV
jgi:methyl-accepting chemotaxis protein